MESTNSLGLPDFVYRLLLSKSEDVHSKLDFNINGTGDNIEITLRWTKWGSRWEDPFDCRATKYKSFSNRKRDSNRRKMFNVERNSKSVSTDNIDNESQTGFDMCDMDLTTPISAPKKTVQGISDAEKHSVHQKGHMVLRSNVAYEKEIRRKCDSFSSAADILSPTSIGTPQFETDMSMTMTDHEGHGHACYLGADHADDNNNNDCVGTESNVTLDEESDDSYMSDKESTDNIQETTKSLRGILDQLKAMEVQFDKMNDKQKDLPKFESNKTISSNNPG